MRSPSVLLLRAAAVAPLLALPSSVARAQPSPPRPAVAVEEGRRRALATLDSVAEATVGRGRAAGLVALVVRGRDTLVARAVGRADVENDAPLTVDHVFQLASITKQFTAAAVLALVDSGLVALDAPITRYLPDAPVQGRTVTVRQLLAHSAGIPDVAESPGLAALKPRDVPPDTVLALVRATPFYFAPGDQMRYSNTGYILLGQLVERVSGRPYASFVEERLLRPAGAARAHLCDPARLVPRLARGYALGPQGLRPAAHISPTIPWAAGGFCGTAGDLAAWNAALHAAGGGRLLTPASYAAMTRPGRVRGGRATRYGLGLALGDVAGRPARHHGGDIDGFTTFTAYLPDDSLGVTVLLNTQGPTRPDQVAAALVNAVLGAPATSVADDRPPLPAGLAPFVGTFGGDVRVAVAPDGDGRPALRLTRGPMPPVLLRVVGQGPDGWTFTDGRARYTFVPGAARSAAVWADLGVSVVIWERTPDVPPRRER